MRFIIIFAFLLILIIYVNSAPANTKKKQKNAKKADTVKKDATKKGTSNGDKSKGSEKGMNGKYYGGDMKGFVPPKKGQLRKASTNPLWPNKMVVYKIEESDYSEEDIVFINWAIEHISNKTCIKFKKRTNERNYLRIFSGTGCYSYVGFLGGSQDLSLQFDGCLFKGTILHEIMHSLGFWHEHTRPDRDQYLKINMNNVVASQTHQFDKLPDSRCKILGTFDRNSVMLYGSKVFSMNGMDTMTWKDGNLPLVPAYAKTELSTGDIEQIKLLYGC